MSKEQFRNIEEHPRNSPVIRSGEDAGIFGLDLTTVSLPNTLSGKITCGFTVFDAIMVFVILMFVAYVRDKKVKGELQYSSIVAAGRYKSKKPLPTAVNDGFRKYAVLLETGQSPGGGTTSVIFIRLIGKLTKSPAFSLSWSNEHGDRHLFWSQNKDIFILSVPHYLGYIEEIEVVTDKTGDSPPWFLRSIRVMCLDNNKCWRSDVNAWLRGDRKPFSFKTYLIGALSTREYVTKVFLQNHIWTMMWWRKLGSGFTCTQRCSIHWCSFVVGMYVAHFLTFANPYDADTVSSYSPIPVEYFIRGDDAVLAGVLGAAAGSIVGVLMRFIARKMTSSTNWARVDDKDDFGHIMDPQNLIFEEGAVVKVNKPKYVGPKFPYPPCIEADSVRDILEKLTSEQRAALKKMTECSKEGCGIKHFVDTGDCCKDEPVEEEVEEKEGSLIEAVLVEENENVRESSATSESVDDRMPADERGFRASVFDMMSKTMKRMHSDSEYVEESQASTQEGQRTFLGNLQKSIVRDNTKNIPIPRSRTQRKKKFVKRRSKYSNKIPMVSAGPNMDDFSSQLSEEMMSALDASFNDPKSKSSLLDQTLNNFDSLSEPESDEDIVTKFTRTESEINLRRRPSNTYDQAPLWDDRNRVYVTSLGGGNHHSVMKKRYAQTANNDTVCCQEHGAKGDFGEQAIHNYLNEETGMVPGGIVDGGSGSATAVSGLAGLIAFVLPLYVLYERFVLPNAHGLYYLYAVVICFVMHALFFSTLDAGICSVLATFARRRRVAQAREGNIEFDDMPQNNEVVEIQNGNSKIISSSTLQNT